MAAHEVRLERRDVGERHEMLAERTAARVDAVDEPIRPLEAHELRICGVDAGPHRVRDREARATRDPHDLHERHRRRWRNDDRIAHSRRRYPTMRNAAICASNSVERRESFCYPNRMPALRPFSRLLVLVAALVTAAACDRMRPAEVPHPLNGAARFLCCNLYYEKPEISDVAYQVGTKIPFGTRVHIERVRKDRIEFTPEGHPTITLDYKYGDKTVPFETYLSHLLLESDPHRELRKVPAKRVTAIEQGLVEQGMTKAQVKMARGLPPFHRTPSLDSPTWTYWQTRWDTMAVYFAGDKVERVQH